MPAFSKLFDALHSGTQCCQREACHRYWKTILKMLTAPRFLGKDFKGENHKPSRNLIKLVGWLEKQSPRIPFDKTMRACRALTILRITGAGMMCLIKAKSTSKVNVKCTNASASPVNALVSWLNIYFRELIHSTV